MTDSQPPEGQAPVQKQTAAVIGTQIQTDGQNTIQRPPCPAEDIQAQQQAALEQKKLLDAMETEIDQLDSRAASAESSVDTLEQQLHSVVWVCAAT